jgi:hypothetical protein
MLSGCVSVRMTGRLAGLTQRFAGQEIWSKCGCCLTTNPYKARRAVVNGIFRRRHNVKSIADLSANGCSFSRGMPRKWAMELSFTPEEKLPIGSRQLLQEVMQTLFGDSPATKSENKPGVTSCLVDIKKLKADIARLTNLIFPANTVLRGTRGKVAR